MKHRVSPPRIPTTSLAHDAGRIREHGAVMATILSNMQTVLRQMLDALAGAWMRRAASEAERAQPRITDEQ
jgi:hypothetical protein